MRKDIDAEGGAGGAFECHAPGGVTVAVFDNGALVEYGSHEQLVRAGKLYAEMWEAQAQYYQ